LTKHFADEKIKIISEPGTYFAEKSFTLYANVVSKVVKLNDEGEKVIHYYITDGIYQSFKMNSTHEFRTPVRPLKSYKDMTVKKSVIWGRSCDSHDRVFEEIFLPEVACGDWLVFDDTGAYRTTTSSNFNGFPNHKVYSFIEKGDL
jgi:ornithine decarboxylase